MQIKLTKDLKWSPDGCSVTTILADDYAQDDIPERAQVIAGQLGIIQTLDCGDSEKTIPPEPEPEPEPIKKGKK